MGPAKLGKNQVNYSDRAAQAFNPTRKERRVSTSPPETRTFGATMSQWSVSDAYLGWQAYGAVPVVCCHAVLVLLGSTASQSGRKAATSGSPLRQCGSRCTWLSATCRDTGTTLAARRVRQGVHAVRQ